MTVDASERAYARAALLLVLVGTALHLTYSTHLELVGDEAYYWLWSRRPDISYVDKGPMVAWFIRAGTSLFGQTVFGVRFFAAILAGGTGFGLYWLGKELFSPRVGFWAIVVASVMPLFFVGASLMTIDTVYVFFWTWAAWAFWHAKDETRLRWWVLTGVLVGLGLLSKYTGRPGAFLLCRFLPLASAESRPFSAPHLLDHDCCGIGFSHSGTCLEYQRRVADDSLARATRRLERTFFPSSFLCAVLSRKPGRNRIAAPVPCFDLLSSVALGSCAPASLPAVTRSRSSCHSSDFICCSVFTIWSRLIGRPQPT